MDCTTRARATLPPASMRISTSTVPSIFLTNASCGYWGLVILIGSPYTVAIGGVISLAGTLYFIWRLPALRKAARPMLEKAGVLPPIAEGLQSATQVTQT